VPEHKRIEDIDLTTFQLKIMVYGPWGSGKTWFCGTAPEPHFLCTEEGLIGLRIAGIKGGYSTFLDYDDYLRALADVELGRVPPFKTLCLDGISELCFLVYKKVKDITHQTVLRIQDWGLVTDMTRMCMNQMLSLGNKLKVNIIATARQDTRDDKDTKARLWGPDILGAYRKAGPGAFDMVLYAKQEALFNNGKRQARYWLSTVEADGFPAKDRTTTLDMVEPNDFPTIWSKFTSGKRSGIEVAKITQS
jgi:hypothetical protein